MQLYINLLKQRQHFMLVHLKPRKQHKQTEIMENYATQTNWNYRVANPIHCKKSQKVSKIKQILTQNVSTFGTSLTPKHKQHSLSDNLSHQQTKSIKNRQTIEQSKKLSEHLEKGTVQLSTLYKKSFKYNTTIYQIIKNLAKNSQSRNIKLTCRTQIAKEYSSQKYSEFLKSEPTLELDGKVSKNYEQNPITQRLKKLERLKKQCSQLENVSQKYQDKYCQINQFKFLESEKDKNSMKVSLYQWKCSKPHFTKLKWKKDARIKNNIRKNLTLNSKLQRQKEYEQRSQQKYEYLSSMYYPNPTDGSIFKTYYKSQIDSNRQICEQLTPKNMGVQNCQVETYRTVDDRQTKEKYWRSKKCSKPSIKNNSFESPEMPVDGWNTREKEEHELFNNIML